MQRSILLFAMLYVSALVSGAAAQPAGYVEVSSLRSLPSKSFGCIQLQTGIIDREKLAELRKIPNCIEHLPTFADENAENRSLVYYSVSSDCHMRVAVKVLRIDAEKKYLVVISNIYGGCRAGGVRSGWLSFDKMPADYQLEIKEVRVDREAEFVYPKPPTTKSQTTTSIREVELGECLKLSGQSQWVLANSDGLDRALNTETPSCREKVKNLGLDLSKQALVGYSFHSGYCDRPVGLEFSAIHETSSDPKEDRLMIKAQFRDVGDAYCKIWTTYPVWLIVEKPAGHVRYEFFSEPKK